MKCPFCGYAETQVIDSRITNKGFVVRRRRYCPKCNRRFTTYERIESIVKVVKRDGRKEDFSREKLIRGILNACNKTSISREDVERIADDVELVCRAKGEVKSKEIGELVMKKLRHLDKVAYVRFASVYKKFKAIEDFEKEIEKLSK